jgi:hypothetical protein
MSAKKSQYWILPIHRSVEAEPPVGPFNDYPEMLKKAREIKKEQKDEDGIFWLHMKANGKLHSGSFGHLEIEPEEIGVQS